MSATHRSEGEMKQAIDKQLRITTDPLEKLRLQCLSRGCAGIKGLGRMFRIYDDDGNRKLSLEEFEKGVHDYGVKIDADELKAIFAALDKDNSGNIDFDEFLLAIRALEFRVPFANAWDINTDESWCTTGLVKHGETDKPRLNAWLQPPMSAPRQKMVMLAFNKADRTGDGVIRIDDLRGVYDVSRHPKYIAGEKTKDELLKDFLNTFQVGQDDAEVTKDDFLNYYAGVSASIDSDIYFDLMMRNAWKL